MPLINTFIRLVDAFPFISTSESISLLIIIHSLILEIFNFYDKNFEIYFIMEWEEYMTGSVLLVSPLISELPISNGSLFISMLLDFSVVVFRSLLVVCTKAYFSVILSL